MTAEIGNSNVHAIAAIFVMTSHASADHKAAERDADHAADEREHDGFHEELLENVVVGGADGFAQADLLRAFNDGHEHDVHDADAADDERDGSDRGEEERQDGRDVAEEREHVLLGLDRKIIFVGIGDVVVLFKDRFHARLRETDVVIAVRLHHDVVEIGDAEHLLLRDGDRARARDYPDRCRTRRCPLAASTPTTRNWMFLTWIYCPTGSDRRRRASSRASEPMTAT